MVTKQNLNVLDKLRNTANAILRRDNSSYMNKIQLFITFYVNKRFIYCHAHSLTFAPELVAWTALEMCEYQHFFHIDSISTTYCSYCTIVRLRDIRLYIEVSAIDL